MKKTLETYLMEEAKTEQKSEAYSTFAELLNYYFTNHTNIKVNTNKIGNTLTPDTQPIAFVNSWEYIPYFIGTIYKMTEDGLNPFSFLNMTKTEEDQFRAMCSKIRSAVSSTAAPRATVTKQLYDQVKQLGF